MSVQPVPVPVVTLDQLDSAIAAQSDEVKTLRDLLAKSQADNAALQAKIAALGQHDMKAELNAVMANTALLVQACGAVTPPVQVNPNPNSGPTPQNPSVQVTQPLPPTSGTTKP